VTRSPSRPSIRSLALGRPADALLHETYERLRSLLAPRRLALGLALAFVAGGPKGFFLVVRAYAPAASVLAGIFNYTASTFLGGLTLLPGGLLAAEGALTALLDAQGLSTASAASATLIIRAATFWFARALGLTALVPVGRWLRH
jgi:glycosyltransferase 2 family protein